MSHNLALNLTRTAAEHPDVIACKLDDAAFNYGLLDQASARVAAMLKSKGVGPGDRVGIMLPNVPYFPAVYYGVLRAGGVVVPMNVLLKAREVGFYLSDPEVKVLFAWHGFLEAAEQGAADAGGVDVVSVKPGEIEGLIFAHEPDEEVAERAGDDTAVILYTSGTTGRPKGAELTHDNLRRNVEVAVSLFDLGVGSVIFAGLPLFHSFGQTCTMNAAVLGGATITLLPRFDPGRALEIIERDRCAVFEGVPTMYGALLHHPEREKFDVSCLRVCASGGAALPVEVLRGFEEAFGCKVLEGYGLSETSPVASFNHPDRERKAGSIGTPIEGVEFRLVDELANEIGTAHVWNNLNNNQIVLTGGG
jgi:long-chain acyl-CoA synthetase